MTEFPDRPDDVLPLYRPDILDLRRPDEASTKEIGEWLSSDSRIGHLRSVPLFSDCTDDELRRIGEISQIVEVPAGTVVTESGAPGDSFFMIIDGRVSVQTPVGITEPLRPRRLFWRDELARRRASLSHSDRGD